MIKLAAEVGVDYVKFQSFRARDLNKNYPDYENAYKNYLALELDDWTHMRIIKWCKDYGVKPLFTAFTLERAEFLHDIGMKIVKIGSAEASDEKLFNMCIKMFDEVIVSMGMVSKTSALGYFSHYFTADRLYCLSRYPAPYEDIDFEMIELLNGFSDHTADLRASKKAIEMGVKYVERHFTLSRDLPGKDHLFSSTADEFRELVEYRNYLESIPRYKARWTNA
jgi:N,N'-diacetyllegionaminate synthase